MGGLLAKPITTKETEDGGDPSGRNGLAFGVSAMQGWREGMEDAHMAIPDFDSERQLGLFGVFDGHGGSAVAKVVAATFPATLKRQKSFIQGHYCEALYQVTNISNRQSSWLHLRPWAAKEVSAEVANGGGCHGAMMWPIPQINSWGPPCEKWSCSCFCWSTIMRMCTQQGFATLKAHALHCSSDGSNPNSSQERDCCILGLHLQPGSLRAAFAMFWLLPVLVWVVAFTAVTVLRDGTVGHMPKEPSREKERPPPPRGLEPDSLLFYFGNLDEREGIFTQDGESLALKIFEKLGNEAKDKPWNDAAMKPSVDAGVAVLSEGFFFSSELQQYMDIVDNKRIEKWEEEARKLRQQHLENAHEQLQQSIQKPPSLSLKKVVQSLQSTSTKSPKFMKPLEHFRNESERFKWPVHSQRLSALASMEKQVEEANGIYQNVSALKGQERKFRPVQLVAMYAMAKMANDGERIVAQMKTGEGKTDVCAAIASILARGGRFIAVHIITSGEANAKKDFMATKDYIKAATGHEPILASDGIPWNENDEDWTHARIVYCQITDIMKSLVKAMQNSRLDKIQKYLSRSYALVDEADFVMFEQGSNQLYVSSAVQGYSALMPFLFRAAGLLDYHAEYDPAQIKTQTEVGGKIGYFIDDLKKPLKELEGSIRHDGTWFSSVPSMVDKDGKFVSIAQGALQARLKLSDQDYVVTRKQGGHAEITIVNLANGEEAYGSRWINEGPFAEVQQGLPIQGMEPIAFFASVQLALMTHGGFGGITGTVGNSACLDFLGKHFSISGLYRFPRNTPTMMYWLDAQEATTTEGQHKNIFESVLNFNKGEMTKSGRYGVPKQPSAELKGPVEIVFKTIQECKAFESFLKNNGRGDDFNVIPFYRSSMHSMLEGPVPTNTIIIASNMGGRGLDIKLHKHDVLLVILTQVLDDRQDMQARGRCGRNGKPGVIQYQLLKSTPGSSNEDVTVTLVRSKYFSGVKADQELQSRSPLLQRDMKATKVLESFSTTRMPYIEGWLEKLFAGLSLKDDLEPLVKGFLQQFIISIYDKRWACWKDSSSPRREESHSLPDFRRTYHLSNPVDLGEGRTATDPVEELARRLYALCHVLRLDAAEATELASTLLRIKGEKWLLMLSAKLLLHSSGNESPWPSKFAGHRWQSDWTGKAGLLLAMVSPEYRAEGLRRYSVALKHLAKQLSEIPDLEGLAHNRGKRLQDKVHRDIRPFYPEQLQLAQEQVKHLRQHVDRLVGTGHLQLESLQMSLAKEAFSVDGMSISVKDLRQLMGQKWTEAIFSVRPAGTGWAIPSRKGDFKDWTKHLEMVGQEGQGGDGPDSNARSSGGGGGPNQRMEAQTSEQSQEVETALIEALNENSATDIKGFQDEFQASSVKADFSNMDTGSGYFSTMLSKFKEKVSFLQATSSWCEKMGSYAQEAWSRISEAAKDASWFKAKKSQGEEKKQEVVKEAHRLMQEAVDKYNKEAADVLDREFPPSSRRSEDFDPGRVEANGKKDTRSQAEIELEAKAEEDAAQFYAFDKDASADDRFLQAHALAAIKKDLARQPGGEELAETMDELERLNSALTQKAQEAKLAGKELCSDQEARAIQQAYVNVLRAALEVMKFADETGLSSVSELWDKANTMIWRKNQEGLHRSWIGWIFCPFSRWNYVEARNAFERFEKWGDSPLFNTEKMPGADKLLLFNIQKFRSSGLLMSQRLRRRCALREFTNANWFESLQDRANTEYLRRWQQTQTELQFVLIGLSILIAIIGFFTGGLALAVLALVAALAQLVLAVLTNNVEDRTDLTREEKQQLSNIYSVVMSVLGLLHLGLSSVCSQVAQKVAEWLTKLVNYMRMLQAAVATPFLMQTVSRLTSSDQLLQQGDGTLWGSLAAVCQLVMDLIGLGNALRPRAVPVEEEGPTRRPGRRPEDGGQDDAERNNDAVEHDTESSGWTLAGALTALGTMLRSLVRERTRTNEASKTEREPKKEELNSAERNQEVRRRDLKADGQIHASVIEEKIELQVQNDNDQGATMYMEEHGQKVLQTENGQFQYAGKKIDPNLQRQILQNKGFKEDEDFHVSNDGIARLMGQSEAVDKHGDTADTADTANSASWNNFVSLLLALEKVPESDRSKFTRLVMEQAFSREKTPTLQEVVSKRISSDSVKADDAGMKVQRSDELELAGDGSSLRLRMTEDEVPSETGSTSIQVDNANLKVSSQGIEPSGTLPKENAKLLFNMLNQDAENFCLDAEAVEEMVNSLPDEVNLEQMAEALHSAEAKAQPSPERQAAERQDENPERAQVSKRDVVESFVVTCCPGDSGDRSTILAVSGGLISKRELP
eukprot:s272_g36.t1